MEIRLSVIIPTANRPQYLPRAVESALAGMPEDEIEVIVVPNGPDQSWRDSLKPFLGHPALRVLPISEANANIARNTGLDAARGKYVRLLDDDDYLFPEAARAQLEYIENAGAEFCSGRLLNLDESGNRLGEISFPATRDFVCACMSISGFTLPVGNIILRSCIGDTRWNINIARSQDNVWMMNLAASREWKWVHFDTPVGCWFQHPYHRISTARTAIDRPGKVIEVILSLYDSLQKDGRLNDSRRLAVSEILWYFVHRSFPHQPFFLTRVARIAKKIDESSRPLHPIFNNFIVRSVDPLLFEWLVYPLRVVARAMKDFIGHFWGWDYRRKL